ncbi:L-fucose/L-arabinose isomerase family protein [Salinispira pacifica]
MQREDELIVGLVGAVHPNMPGDDAGLFRNVAGSMKELAGRMGFQIVVFPGLLRSEEDGAAARRFMEENHADLTILFNASLPFGRVILPLARVSGRLAFWSVPEPATEGILQLNSFCGTNMLASIVANYLTQYDIAYKWLYGMPDDARFQERLGVTIRALKAEKALAGARIAQIGGLANGFENLYIDERVLEYRFGCRLQTRHSVEEIVERAERLDVAEVKRAADELSGEPASVAEGVLPAHLEKSARLYAAFRDFIAENGYTAVAISCWSRFQERYGVAVCGVLSRLNEHGIVAACEGDIPAVVNMIMLNAMNGGRASLNDLVAFDENDSTLNLWHCGVAPGCWADSRGVRWDRHFNIGRYDGSEWVGDGVVADLRFHSGEVTIATVDNSFSNLFVMSGEIVEGKEPYRGSSGWVEKLRVNGAPVGINDLINTIVVERVNHHYPTAYGNLVNELNEFAAWKGLRMIDARPYRPYLQRPERFELSAGRPAL